MNWIVDSRGRLYATWEDWVLRASYERQAVVGRDAANAARNADDSEKLDRLDEAFIYAKAIDLDSDERQ